MEDQLPWRKLSEEKPPKEGVYLVHVTTADTKKPFMATAWWDTKEFGYPLIPAFGAAVDHWCPLIPPKP
jgi:hypothetical protein